MTTVLENLVINRAAIRRNLAFLHGINMAESVMIELTRKGMNRQDSHERVRMASMQALAEDRPLADVLGSDAEVVRYCSKGDITALLSPDAYIGTAVLQVERLMAKLSPICI
jgi:Adenylosuccinate lyase (EC 4.3.2.2)